MGVFLSYSVYSQPYLNHILVQTDSQGANRLRIYTRKSDKNSLRSNIFKYWDKNKSGSFTCNLSGDAEVL